ncbi:MULTISPECIES: STAS domain-containing protein [Microcoleaceae]|uniref:STAS domain-containing protein n=1 Tax=Microcoleaceae TaxID=1892252 RepID=UPI001880113C|nr:STAS domain-containing protein [Tychonema sp. LEGE 06208]MBE9165468.1 STAS domain-containing protein [Tychonema sp. LEGE 06208]
MQTLLAPKPITVIQPLYHLNAATSGEFGQQVTTAIETEGIVAVLVDLGAVTFIDSAGLIALVSGLKQAKKMGRRFSICSVCTQIRMVLELSQLDRVFEIFESVESFEAANSRAPNHW